MEVVPKNVLIIRRLKTILLYLLIDVIGISEVLAPIIMFIVVPINFTLNKLWVFKS
ncbi:MAG: GtrA family protein [Oscillospiraceae bacterium]|nr:GtrA family protein [Oscillospiraceae bacterium]